MRVRGDRVNFKKEKTRLLTLIVCLAVLTAAPKLSAQAVEPGAAAPLPEKHRIVLLEGYELSAPLGAWDRVVGISSYAYDNDLLQRLVPQLREIPSPGTGFAINMEVMLALRPDLVVTWSRKPEVLDYLKRHGIPVLSFYPENLADLYQDLMRLGQIFGKTIRAGEVSGLIRQNLAAIQQRVANIPGERVRVVWLWGKPTIITGNKGVTHELINLTGGRNLGAHIDDFNRDISMEEIVALNPEVILIWGSAIYGPDDLKRDPKWQTVQAVKQNRVFKASRASNWSPRIVDLAWWMAHCCYPQEISRTEMLATLRQYYNACLGIPYPEGN
ncbi:MAG TPA: ABC transporter substrate-binding protein [Desulfobacterales bacterium]|nr:ABC transporter substrate-binding protein [Desulfobacterales bacterium]